MGSQPRQPSVLYSATEECRKRSWSAARNSPLRGPLKLPLGIHGSLLPIILVPAGITLARALDVFTIQMSFALPIIPIGMALYYLLWRHAVAFLNREMGIA